MSEFDFDATAFADALEEPLDTLASVLLFGGVALLSAGVAVRLFAIHTVTEVCATRACTQLVIGSANDVLGVVAVLGAVILAAGMLLPELVGGESL